MDDSSAGNVLPSYCCTDATNDDKHEPESDGDQDRHIRDRTNNTLITPRGGNNTMHAVIPIPSKSQWRWRGLCTGKMQRMLRVLYMDRLEWIFG